MKDMRVLAMDYGASSGRGIVGIYDGERLCTEEVHRFDNKPVTMAGRLLWDLPSLYGSIAPALSEAKARFGGVSSVGIDTWGVDYGYIDKNGHLLSLSVHYRDSRTDSVRDEFFRVIPWDELYSVTGIQDLAFNTIYQLWCDVKNDSHVVGAAERMMFIPDLFNYFLSGEMRTEYTIASTGAILDAKTRGLAGDLLSRIGFEGSMLPPLTEPSTVIGKLRGDVRDAAGGDVDVVATASHDTASAVLAVPASGVDFVYISCGTWSLLGTELSSPLINDRSRELSFTNEGGAGGTIRFLKNISGLWLKQESRRQYAREGVRYTHDELSDAAASSMSCRYIIDPDDDAFTPPGNMVTRIADYCERTGQGRPESVGEVMRCIFDSLTMRYRWGVEKIRELTGRQASEIHIVGGGVKESVLCQMTADKCGIPVVAGPAEATSIGNICSQLIARGELSGISEARELVRRSCEPTVYEPNVGRPDAELEDRVYNEVFLKLIEK